MKLMDKIKDLFMDEVIDDDELEVEEKAEYKEPPKEEMRSFPKVMRESIDKEEKKTPEPKVEVKKEIVPEKVVEQPKKFNFPIDFEEEVTKAEQKESIPKRNNNYPEIDESLKSVGFGNRNINVLNLEKETPKKIAELYPKKEEIKPKFKASPVISPVYGVLDKNYTKEEVREKTDDNNTMKRPSKKVDFETVRKKAFGNLADEIKDNLLCENCELYKEVKKISALSEDDLLYDMTVDNEESEPELTIEKAYDNYHEFGVAYEPKPQKKVVSEPIVDDDFEIPKELENIINDVHNDDEEATKEAYIPLMDKIETEETIISEPLDEPTEAVKEEMIPTREEKRKEAKVDDDFFELIDSMYKERIDD